jgi:hypothetical protein
VWFYIKWKEYSMQFGNVEELRTFRKDCKVDGNKLKCLKGGFEFFFPHVIDNVNVL